MSHGTWEGGTMRNFLPSREQKQRVLYLEFSPCFCCVYEQKKVYIKFFISHTHPEHSQDMQLVDKLMDSLSVKLKIPENISHKVSQAKQ